MLSIEKLCADSLRELAYNKYNIKLKASHAHELVAASFGYHSRAALLADTAAPISNLQQAKFIVPHSTTFIDQRRRNLKGLSPDLPSEIITENFYSTLAAAKCPEARIYPIKELTKLITENDEMYNYTFKSYDKIPLEHYIRVKSIKNGMTLTVHHCYQASTGETLCAGDTDIYLPRMAGYIGYGEPQVHVTKRTGLRRKINSPWF